MNPIPKAVLLNRLQNRRQNLALARLQPADFCKRIVDAAKTQKQIRTSA